jgi:hypothetical protein
MIVGCRLPFEGTTGHGSAGPLLLPLAPSLLGCLTADAEPGRDLGPRVPRFAQSDHGQDDGLVQLGGEPGHVARASTSPPATRLA